MSRTAFTPLQPSRAWILLATFCMCLGLSIWRQAYSSVNKRSAAVARAMGSFTYQYARPSVTVDTVIVAKPAAGAPSKVLLIKRKNPPCQGRWALPGGFVDADEPLHAAAARELQEETSVAPESVNLIQTGAYGDPGRDPRGWCVTVAYAAVVPSTDIGVQAADDAADASWFSVTELPQPLAFDHKVILREALQKLAAQPEAADAAMQEQLRAGAASLEGPWTPPTE